MADIGCTYYATPQENVEIFTEIARIDGVRFFVFLFPPRESRFCNEAEAIKHIGSTHRDCRIVFYLRRLPEELGRYFQSAESLPDALHLQVGRLEGGVLKRTELHSRCFDLEISAVWKQVVARLRRKLACGGVLYGANGIQVSVADRRFSKGSLELLDSGVELRYGKNGYERPKADIKLPWVKE